MRNIVKSGLPGRRQIVRPNVMAGHSRSKNGVASTNAPAIPVLMATPCQINRDRRNKSGDDERSDYDNGA
jgi:hypothetical protein